MTMMEKITGQDEKAKDSHAAIAVPEQVKKQEKVLILTADNTEDTEFFYPYYRLTEEGYTVEVATPKGGRFEAKHGLGLNHSLSIRDARPQDYALLYIPGGKAPAELRENKDALIFVREFARSGKPIAAICHGPQVLISADLIRGKRIAAWPEVAGEIKEAGGIFIDEGLVEDGQFITGRKPGDLPRHLYGVLRRMRGALSGSTATRKAVA